MLSELNQIFLHEDPNVRFVAYGYSHIAVLVIAFLVAIFAILTARLAKTPSPLSSPPYGGEGRVRGRRIIDWAFAVLLVASEVFWSVFEIANGRWNITTGVPLQLCDIGIYITAYALITKRQTAYEYAYFWGLAATLHGFLTPNLQEPFPHYAFIKFFTAHGGIIASILYLTLGVGLKPRGGFVWRLFFATNLYAGGVGIFNWIFRTNYLFLCAKPANPSILDYLGPWPFYILSLEAVTILSLWLLYVPFWLAENLKSERSGNR